LSSKSKSKQQMRLQYKKHENILTMAINQFHQFKREPLHSPLSIMDWSCTVCTYLNTKPLALVCEVSPFAHIFSKPSPPPRECNVPFFAHFPNPIYHLPLPSPADVPYRAATW
jgi:hypothetical protein